MLGGGEEVNGQINYPKQRYIKIWQHPSLEAISIPPLILVHRLSYNLSGELLAGKETNFGKNLLCAWDLAIPYIPLFILPYLFAWVYPLFILIYCVVTKTYNHQTFRYFYLSILALTVLELLLWQLFPASIIIRVPSEVLADHGILGSMTAYVYDRATPWNVFPSAHIATAYLFWLLSKHFAPGKQHRLFLIIFLLITLSVVFVKNHYLADIAGGILVAHLVYRVVFLPVFSRELLHNISTFTVIGFNGLILFIVASCYRLAIE